MAPVSLIRADCSRERAGTWKLLVFSYENSKIVPDLIGGVFGGWTPSFMYLITYIVLVTLGFTRSIYITFHTDNDSQLSNSRVAR